MLEIHTMGSARCQVNLCMILNEIGDQKLIHKVTRLYHKYNYGMKQLRDVKDVNMKVRMLRLWKEEHIAIVNGKFGFNKHNPLSEKIKSHLESSLTVCMKDEVRRIKGIL